MSLQLDRDDEGIGLFLTHPLEHGHYLMGGIIGLKMILFIQLTNHKIVITLYTM